MEKVARIRINLTNREIEIEGPESFIDKYDSVITEFIEKVRHSGTSKTTGNSIVQETSQRSQDKTTLPDTFGEFYSRYPRNLSVSDKILIAGYFIQLKNGEGLFTPSETSNLLKEQAVNVTNANAFLKSLLNGNKIFKTAGKYKISEKGIEYINQIPDSSK